MLWLDATSSPQIHMGLRLHRATTWVGFFKSWNEPTQRKIGIPGLKLAFLSRALSKVCSDVLFSLSIFHHMKLYGANFCQSIHELHFWIDGWVCIKQSTKKSKHLKRSWFASRRSAVLLMTSLFSEFLEKRYKTWCELSSGLFLLGFKTIARGCWSCMSAEYVLTGLQDFYSTCIIFSVCARASRMRRERSDELWCT